MRSGDSHPRVHNPVEGSAEIAALRAKLGLTQAAFAQRFGLSVDSLRQWEQWRRVPEAQMMASLVEAEGLPPRSTSPSLK